MKVSPRVRFAWCNHTLHRDHSPAGLAAGTRPGDGGQYPASVVEESWTAVCDLQSRVIRDWRAAGGQGDRACGCFKGTFAECRWRLRSAGAKCSALSFGKDNRCCLHDRTAPDYKVAHEAGARHTVKMLSAFDPCLSLPSEKFVALQGRIANMMRKHSLHARTSLAVVGKKFFLYDGPAFKWRDLLTCYRNENGRVAPWEDERWPELAQNTGQLWVHEQLAGHPARTTNPAEASLFVVPLESYVSGKLKFACRGTDHKERMRRAARAVAESPHFKKNQVCAGRRPLAACSC